MRSLKTLINNSSLDSDKKYMLESILSLSDDTTTVESFVDIIEFNNYIIESKKEIESSEIYDTFVEKSESILSTKIDELMKYSGGNYSIDEYIDIKESIEEKELLLKEFVELCKYNISEGKELPCFNSKVLLESSSISERKKNDILMEYQYLDDHDKQIIDSYYNYVICDRITESASEGNPSDEARIRAKEKILNLAMGAVAVGTVIKVSEVLYLRKILKEFGDKYKIKSLSSLNKVSYDEDEIPKSLKSKMTWNEVGYNYKMEVYCDKNKVVCGRIYAYTCSKAKIKFSLLSQPRKGSIVKVSYFVIPGDEYRQNYYMMGMSLEDRIAHESIKRVTTHMKEMYKKDKKKK